LDPETGLQLNRNRFYHQQLGRWVNRDPIKYKGGGWNLYEYNNSMPIDKIDPNGTTPKNLRECNARCLGSHKGWFVNQSLLDCYQACDENHDECADMRTQLMSALIKMCDKQFANGLISQKDRAKCEQEAVCISIGIDKTCRGGGRPLRPRNPFSQQVKGNWCYEWAYGFENACDECNPGHFDCKIDWAAWQQPNEDGNIPIHSWCEIGCGDDAVFVDDGFFGGGISCHKERPCSGKYEWPNSGFGRPPRPGEDGCCPAKP